METVRIRGQDVVKPKAEMTVYEDDWSKYEVQDVQKSFLSEKKVGEKYLPAWWAANLDLRRSLNYMHHWGIGQNDKLGQHDTGIDPGLAGHRPPEPDVELKQRVSHENRDSPASWFNSNQPATRPCP